MRKVAVYLIAIGIAVGVCVGLAYLARGQAWRQPDAAIESAYTSELAMATEQGLLASPETRTDDDRAATSVSLEAGECFAVVAASYGVTPLHVYVHWDGGRLEHDADVVHLASCVDAPTAVAIEITRPYAPSFEVDESMRYTLLRGPLRAPRTYPRLAIDDAQRDAFDAAAVRARMEPHVGGGRALGAERVADPEHAVLLPASRATFAALRALSGRRDLAPSTVADPSFADPFSSPTDTRVPARAFTPSGRERVLAVVDAGALGASCLEVVLARLDAPTDAAIVTRTSVPDLATTTLESTDPALAIDTLCPATGLFVYTMPEGAAGDVVVNVARTDGEALVEVGPSHFGDAVTGRHPSDGLVVLPVALVASSRTACASLDAEACFALAALAHERIEGAGTVREALEPLCTQRGGTACDVLAGAIEESAPEESDALEERACVTGVCDACLRRGARFLDGATDLAAAYRAFSRGCTHGCPQCCVARGTMDEWQLTPPGASIPEPGAPE